MKFTNCNFKIIPDISDGRMTQKQMTREKDRETRNERKEGRKKDGDDREKETKPNHESQCRIVN